MYKIKVLCGLSSTATGYDIITVIYGEKDTETRHYRQMNVNASQMKRFYLKSNSMMMVKIELEIPFKNYRKMFYGKGE